MAKYHKYVFDIEKRKFIGDFENMYRHEMTDVFDSWHQEDQRQLQRKIDLGLINDYNFNCIVDLGCGKGSFTHLLKKKNNTIYAFDISETAVSFAHERYPDIIFLKNDANDLNELNASLDQIIAKHKEIDLFFSSEVLSYLNNWKELIKLLGTKVNYILISLYIPNNPIGFVKSENELIQELNRWFDPVEIISLKVSGFAIYFGKKR